MRKSLVNILQSVLWTYWSVAPRIIDAFLGFPAVCANGGQDTRREVQNCESVKKGNKDWFRECVDHKVQQCLEMGKDIGQQWGTKKL